VVLLIAIHSVVICRRNGSLTKEVSAMKRITPPTELQVLYQPIDALRVNKCNPRIHSKHQITQIADSIRAFGFNNPILVDKENRVLAGHGRWDASKQLGMDSVPTIRLDQMTEAQKRAYVIADNRLAENADWDPQLLGLEFQYLSDLELDFDVAITGFENAEIDILIGDLERAPDPDDEIPALDPTSPPVAQPGDLWHVGRHLLLCGDATREGSFKHILGDEQAQLIFTDPPFNLPIIGHVSGLGRMQHREFPMASGEMTPAQYIGFLRTIFGHLATWSVDGSIHDICMDWRHLLEIMTAARPIYTELKNVCVWNKTNGGMGSLYRSQHELVFVFKNGVTPHINNIELGRYGRNRTNVWDYPGANTLREGRLEELAMHPTVKPVAMVADALLDCSNRNDLVLDCFGGSGTTLIAAEKTGRRACLMELDPGYVDVTLKRYQALTGQMPIHAESKLSWSEIAARAAESRDPAGQTRPGGES